MSCNHISSSATPWLIVLIPALSLFFYAPLFATEIHISPSGTGREVEDVCGLE